MELLNVLNQRFKELQAWRQEVVLLIRKAFTFDDAVLEKPSSSVPFDKGLRLMRGDRGFGLTGQGYWIAARPDLYSRSILITKSYRANIVESRIPAADPHAAIGKLQQELLDFLASAKLEAEPLNW